MRPLDYYNNFTPHGEPLTPEQRLERAQYEREAAEAAAAQRERAEGRAPALPEATEAELAAWEAAEAAAYEEAERRVNICTECGDEFLREPFDPYPDLCVRHIPEDVELIAHNLREVGPWQRDDVAAEEEEERADS